MKVHGIVSELSEATLCGTWKVKMRFLCYHLILEGLLR